ncbi:GTP pyrophosphokinase [Dyella kyungheensis]|uniref:GTP pyrophosphokinase n=1 Tax=Dyella kyungheensis TaxID=1242174 RepID=UPI003CF35B74
MEIGDYIEANRQALMDWGLVISKEVTRTNGTLLKVPASVRVKDLQSARAKQIKKAYADPSRDMTDLVGVRFVVLNSSDLTPIRTQIEQSTSWVARQDRDPDVEIEQAPDTFGYQSHHYTVRPKDPAEGIWCCEVQVRTLLQHAIAELSHDAMYKATREVPSHARRLVARSIALMETTDELLCSAMEAVREAGAPALGLGRVAADVTRALGGTQDLVEDLMSAYASEIDGSSAEGLRKFVRENSFVVDKVRSRSEEGLFAYPSAAVIAYWLVERLEGRMISRWPFPGSRSELSKMFSDLGISL